MKSGDSEPYHLSTGDWFVISELISKGGGRAILPSSSYEPQDDLLWADDIAPASNGHVM